MKRLRHVRWNGLAAASALVFVGSIIVWVRSERARDYASVWWFQPGSAVRLTGERPTNSIGCWLGRGVILVEWRNGLSYADIRDRGENGKSHWYHHATSPARSVFPHWGIADDHHGFLVRKWQDNPRLPDGLTQFVTVALPLWFIALVSGMPPLFRLRPLVASRGRCAVCGYDLRASTDRCPECGTPQQPRTKRVSDSLSES